MKDVHACAAMHATLKVSNVSSSRCKQVRGKGGVWGRQTYLMGNVLFSPGEGGGGEGKENQEAQKGGDGKP